MENIFISIITSFSILIGLGYILINFYRKYINKSYEKKYVDAYLIKDKKVPEAIKKYTEILQSVNKKNPILINTYVLLADLYEKNKENEKAYSLINSLIDLLKNNSFNSEKIYLRQALLLKLRFIKRNNFQVTDYNVIEELKTLFPNDEKVLKEIG